MASVVFVLSCGGDEPRAGVSEQDPVPVSRRYVGCIGATSDPHQFVLSVAEGRDFTRGEPPGTPIPQRSELPEGAPPPIPPVPATTGTPGGGPTPTTKIATYRLVGDGEKNLSALVGHTVEVLGSERRATTDGSSPAEVTPPLYVTSIQGLATYCK